MSSGNNGRSPGAMISRPIPPPFPRNTNNTNNLNVNASVNTSNNNSNNRLGVRLRHLSPHPIPLTSPLVQISNRAVPLPPRNLPGQVQRSRSFDLSPKTPREQLHQEKPSLSQDILEDVIKTYVIDTEEEEKKEKISIQSKNLNM